MVHQVSVCPSRNRRCTGLQPAGSSGLPQDTPRAASFGVYAAFLGEQRHRRIRLGVQRVVDALVGPHSGHGDAAVVGLAVATQPLPPGVRGAGAVLAVPGIVDDQHTAVVRCGGRIAEE
jgi:hypothetical protein